MSTKIFSTSVPFLLPSLALLFSFAVFSPALAFAASPAAPEGTATLPQLLLALSLILIAAKVGGHLALRLGQPEVLGELLSGLVIGNLSLVGVNGLEFLRHDYVITVLSEIGVILLMFDIGLETTVDEMLQVGLSSFAVAVIGVIVPFALGWGVSIYMMPHAHMLHHAFVGAVLCATSVGITARVLKDLGAIQSAEGRIILGAAVIDDVLGLVVLSVMTGIITASNAGTELQLGSVLGIVARAFGFVLAAVFIGRIVLRRWFPLVSNLRGRGLLLPSGLIACFLLSYLAALVGLAPIVGAFAAGLIIEASHYESLSQREGTALAELVHPLTTVFVPVFFVVMGARVELGVFGNQSVVIYALVLALAAVIGKQACSLGVLERGVDRVLVGFGMIPRGEVGLIFASIGAQLKVGGEPVIDTASYGAVVIMVVITTLLAPPLLKWRSTPR